MAETTHPAMTGEEFLARFLRENVPSAAEFVRKFKIVPKKNSLIVKLRADEAQVRELTVADCLTHHLFIAQLLWVLRRQTKDAWDKATKKEGIETYCALLGQFVAALLEARGAVIILLPGSFDPKLGNGLVDSAEFELTETPE